MTTPSPSYKSFIVVVIPSLSDNVALVVDFVCPN